MTRLTDRLPPLPRDRMDAAQQAAADALIAGPRKAVKGPFIPLMRSPELLTRVQKLGEYLRFDSSLPPRISEFVTLIVARHWTQQFEWFVHVPLALKAGCSQATIDALREGRRSAAMSDEEEAAYEFSVELQAHHGVSDATYARCVARFGEQGAVELAGLIGYFAMLSMVLNVARTPPDAVDGIDALPYLPT